MKFEDTIEMMTSTDYRERFRAEYFQLTIRIERLAAMLAKYRTGALEFEPTCSYELLFEQLIYMRGYKRILEKRAELEGLTLEV